MFTWWLTLFLECLLVACILRDLCSGMRRISNCLATSMKPLTTPESINAGKLDFETKRYIEGLCFSFSDNSHRRDYLVESSFLGLRVQLTWYCPISPQYRHRLSCFLCFLISILFALGMASTELCIGFKRKKGAMHLSCLLNCQLCELGKWSLVNMPSRLKSFI